MKCHALIYITGLRDIKPEASIATEYNLIKTFFFFLISRKTEVDVKSDLASNNNRVFTTTIR